MDYMELDFEQAIKRAFCRTSEYDTWKLLINEDCLCAVNLETRKKFVNKFRAACINAGLRFSMLWGDIIWDFPIDSINIDDKLKEFEIALSLILTDTLKGVVKIGEDGVIRYNR